MEASLVGALVVEDEIGVEWGGVVAQGPGLGLGMDAVGTAGSLMLADIGIVGQAGCGVRSAVDAHSKAQLSLD